MITAGTALNDRVIDRNQDICIFNLRLIFLPFHLLEQPGDIRNMKVKSRASQNPLKTTNDACAKLSEETTKESEGPTLHVNSADKQSSNYSQAQESLRQAECIVSYSDDMMALIDNNFVYLATNDAYLKAFGKTREEIIGYTVTKVFGETFFRKIIKPNVDECLNGNHVRYSSWVQFPTTGKRYMDVKYSPYFGTNNETKGAVVIIRDITEHRRSQDRLVAESERLGVTLRSIADGVIATDTSGKIVLINKVAEKLTGWPLHDAQGQTVGSVLNLVHETTKKPCAVQIEKALSFGETAEFPKKTVLISRNLEESLIEGSGAPIKNEENSTIGAVFVFRDLTEKRKMQDALQRNAKLESLGILAGGIAHDFNNLLGGIYGYIDLARKHCKDDRISNYLENVFNTIDRSRSLTGQLLTFAKGGTPLRTTSKVSPFLQDTAQFALSGTNVTCDFDIPDDLWSCVFDKAQIGQVIDNLIINACQAMPFGGKILLSARNLVLKNEDDTPFSNNRYVKISITDQGVGIPPEMHSRIFDPFFTTKTTGHGLGLSTSYSIVTRHNGYIDFDSEPGKGSAFHVFLPASAGETTSSAGKQDLSHRGSGTFVVMDDEQVIRDVVSEMLASMGYNPVCMKNGQETLAFVFAEIEAKRKISGMIFDLTIPGGMGGQETIAEIRKRDDQIPAFVSSGYAEDPVMSNPLEYGFDASISKPFGANELDILLNQYIH